MLRGVAHRALGGSKYFGAAENEKPLQSGCKGFVCELQSGCRLSFSGGVFGVVGRSEWIIWVGGELYHCQICNVDEVLAVVVSIIEREAFGDRADVVVLRFADLRLKRTVAEVAHNHPILAVSLELRAGLDFGDFVEARRGRERVEDASLGEQSVAEEVVGGLRHSGRAFPLPTGRR